MKNWIHRFIWGLSLSLLLVQPALSKEGSVPRRQVGGHYFIPSAVSFYPMVTTNFHTFVGFGYASLKANGDTYKFAALGIDLGGDFAITDWLGFRLTSVGSAIVGVNSLSALGIGAIANVNAGGGPVFRVLRAGPFQLSTGLNVGYVFETTVSPAGALTGNTVTKSNSLDVEPYLAFAIGAGRYFGVQASFGYDLVRNFTSKSNNHEIAAALVASVDVKVVGINVGYRFGRDITGKSNSHKIETGVYYTGRKNLSLGASLTFDIPKSDQLTFILNYTMIYYW